MYNFENRYFGNILKELDLEIHVQFDELSSRCGKVNNIDFSEFDKLKTHYVNLPFFISDVKLSIYRIKTSIEKDLYDKICNLKNSVNFALTEINVESELTWDEKTLFGYVEKIRCQLANLSEIKQNHELLADITILSPKISGYNDYLKYRINQPYSKEIAINILIPYYVNKFIFDVFEFRQGFIESNNVMITYYKTRSLIESYING